MKLEGSLDAFSLPDIFQLLSSTKKTGGLRLQHAGALGVVHFVDGAVTGASTGRGRQTLARRAVGAGLVDHDALAAAVAATDATTGVVQALVNAGALTSEHAAQLVTEHTHDTVFELLRWPAGEFAFAPDENNPDDVGVRLASDEVVTHAADQRDAWDAAASVVPSPDAVAVLVGATEDVVVHPEEWAVLRLVDGSRRVAEIVELTGAGQFSSVTALAALVERGVLAVQDAASSDAADLLDLLAPLETGDAAPVTSASVTSASAARDAAAAAPAPAPDDAVAVDATEDERPAAPTFTERRAESVRNEKARNESARTRSTDGESAGSTSTVVTLPDQAAPASQAPAAPAPEPKAPAARTAPAAPPARTRPAAAPVQAGPTSTAPRLGGAHVPGDVVPPRPEPFLAARRPEFGEQGANLPGSRPTAGSGGPVVGSTAVAAEQLVERDPNVNRSLLLRLIAGVRGL